MVVVVIRGGTDLAKSATPADKSSLDSKKHQVKQDLEKYYTDLKNANSEGAKKERLMQLLRDLFGDDKEVRGIINEMALGSEKTIRNIPVHNRRKTGAADTQIRSLIIEFEKDMSRTGRHAADQLAEYLVGNWITGETYDYTLVATDGLTWVIYGPNAEMLLDYDKINHADRRLLTEIDRFVVKPDTLLMLPTFLDRYLFRITTEKASISSVVRVFGMGSPVFTLAVATLRRYVDQERDRSPSLQVAIREWSRLLQIAYGSYAGDTYSFVVHTYLSMVAKILAYEVLTADSLIDDNELLGILTGSQFDHYNVADFVERDFFGWATDVDHQEIALPVARRIADAMNELTFEDVREDILKGIYQSLIDVETRHGLGEYYTPDWLCERIVRQVTPAKNQVMLDPACGSGSFIRAYIDYLRMTNEGISVATLAEATYGIDVNPLSVQIAKATKLIALGKEVKKEPRPLRLNIFLANALYTPRESLEFFTTAFHVNINERKVSMLADMFDDLASYDHVIAVIDDLAETRAGHPPYPKQEFVRYLRAAVKSHAVSDEHADMYYKVFVAIHEAKNANEDSIWKFILQNVYKPLLIRQKFDFVLGNPPWLTYKQVQKGEYQDVIYNLADRYHAVPDHKKNMPHLELATVFLAHSANYFLNEHGRLAFVMPRAMLSADHNHRLREGTVSGVRLNSIWDLKGVSSLFPVPSCVLFAERKTKRDDASKGKGDVYPNGLPGLEFKGKPKWHNMVWGDVETVINETPRTYYLRRMNSKSALSTSATAVDGVNPYKEKFSQGATIVPRTLMFVDVLQGELSSDISRDDALLLVETSQYALREAKSPWKEFNLRGKVPQRRLFHVVLANSLFPYALDNLNLAVLPVELVRVNDTQSKFEMRSAQQLLNSGDLESHKWFSQAETVWEANRTQKSSTRTLQSWVDYQRKLTKQWIDEAAWYVCYNASGTDASACIVRHRHHARPIVFDAKSYWAKFKTEKEALYVAAFLNSPAVNASMKDFQSQGLFGARDIHMTILNIGLEIFDAHNPRHLEIVSLARECALEAKAYLSSVDLSDMTSHKLGRVRSEIRKVISHNLERIDRLFHLDES